MPFSIFINKAEESIGRSFGTIGLYLIYDTHEQRQIYLSVKRVALLLSHEPPPPQWARFRQIISLLDVRTAV